MDTKFNQRLRYERKVRGWSQAKLAEELGTTPNTISSWERGLMLPSAHFRQLLCTLLGKNAAELGLLPETIAPAEVSQTTAVSPSQSFSVTRAWSNRQRLLDKVFVFWIQGVLERSSYRSNHLSLRLQIDLSAVASPLQREISLEDQDTRSFPSDTSLTQVYDYASGELLVLGEPGAGKTTLLLSLARDLIERAREDEKYPLPVIFNLASWSKKQASFTEWLADELQKKYQISRKLSNEWLADDQILPLLDGLDEVSAPSRAACIDAINAYHQERGLLPIVICCRTTDYQAQDRLLNLHSAIVVQPLTMEQVETYLANTEEQLAIKTALAQDIGLQELATTPLMLNTLTLAYQGRAERNISLTGFPQDQMQQLFVTYVQRMLLRRGTKNRYTAQQTLHWLTWLAQQLIQHNQSEFYLDRMQVDWLTESGRERRLWHLANRLIFGLIFGAIIGLLMDLTNGHPYWLQNIIGVPGFGILSGAIFGLLTSEEAEPEGGKTLLWSWRRWRQSLIAFLTFGVIFGVGLDLNFGLLAGTLSAVIAWTGMIRRSGVEIQPTEVVVWSWVALQHNLIKSLRKGLGSGLLIGLAFGFIFGVISVLAFGWMLGLQIAALAVLIAGLIAGFLISITITLAGGLSSEILPANPFVKPNEGIWRSLSNSLLIGLTIAFITDLVFGLATGLISFLLKDVVFRLAGPLSYVQVNDPTSDAIVGLFIGLLPALAIGLIGWLNYGGAAALQHFVLRLLLWRHKDIPWNYARFLDYAADCILLRKVGGGYIFVHRLLLEYFSSVGAEASFEKDKASKT